MGPRPRTLKVLVTGGQGFVGSALVRALAQREDVSVVATARRGAPELENLGVEVRYGDLCQGSFARDVVAGCNLVYHTAAKAGIWGHWDDYFQINVEATQHLLQGCQTHGVTHFVYTSSPSVTFQGESEVFKTEAAPYGKHPMNPYCASKITAERAVLANHDKGVFEALALRPHLIYGPNDPHLLPRVFAAAKKGRLVRVGDGDNLVDVTHISDVVAAHLSVLNRFGCVEIWGRPYFITSGTPIKLWDWLGGLLEWRGLPPIKRSISLTWARRLGWALERLYGFLKLRNEPPLTEFSALQLGCSHTYSIESARELLGYHPKVDPWAPFDSQFSTAAN